MTLCSTETCESPGLYVYNSGIEDLLSFLCSTWMERLRFFVCLYTLATYLETSLRDADYQRKDFRLITFWSGGWKPCCDLSM